MQVHISSHPVKEAGERISQLIHEHDGDVVCLLSGGSALDVVEYIELLPCCSASAKESTDRDFGEEGNTKCKKYECRTIFMMGDERGSRELKNNNSLQFLNRFSGHPVAQSFIQTVPHEEESLNEFARRVEKNFLEKISKLKNVKIISLLGMGVDGHTAGIFPLLQESFESVYLGDATYVPVHIEGLTIDSRASFTPTWLLTHVDEIVAVVTGDTKRAILESLIKEEKSMHERPAELFKLHSNTHLYTNIAL